MAEMLDVLDGNGVRTGEIVSRKEVHEKGLWHRIALVAIVNDDNEILMQQRSMSTWKFPGLWDLSVASHVQAGEDSISTAVRETNEEVGVQIEYKAKVKDFRFLTSFRNHHTMEDIIENQYYDLFILRRELKLDQLSYNDNEVMDTQWVDYTMLQRLLQENKLHPRQEWIEEVVRYINKF